MAGRPVGLDYGAALSLGDAMQADMEMLAEVLPAVEAALLKRYSDDGPATGAANEFGEEFAPKTDEQKELK